MGLRPQYKQRCVHSFIVLQGYFSSKHISCACLALLDYCRVLVAPKVLEIELFHGVIFVNFWLLLNRRLILFCAFIKPDSFNNQNGSTKNALRNYYLFSATAGAKLITFIIINNWSISNDMGEIWIKISNTKLIATNPFGLQKSTYVPSQGLRLYN
jgi:hypothetical protein